MLPRIIDDIDNEIAGRTSDELGIKFSIDLFNALVRIGKIKMKTFTLSGTKLFPAELPAYNGEFFASVDLALEGLEFRVGVPK
ncbi:hypothetical protein QA648_35725 (plasmid) [Rhizobium sp. CB3171]|uniref:hypothetical protein n=1 Tax=Rhizobium sp. CB3171 TaxID=3039157 RepID=UPI0024B25240|nr:hypothetical protein [Rhizobium sp. CB3171]WFU07399.1 hypothetical protein QA648_35725 [Rhizobium sp. CB3171]